MILPLSLVQAQLPDAAQILNHSRELSLVGTMSATINLSITEKNGQSRNRTISMTTKSFDGGLEKRIIKFIEPADVRGTAMLVVDNQISDDEMWIYLPALKRTRRIVSSEKGKSFMSSEFTNADMSSPAISDFENHHLQTSGEKDVWIIESIPVNEDKEDEYGYSRKISYINMNNYHVEKMEFYNYDNELFKTILINSFHEMPGGKYMVSNMVADNLITGRKSQIVFSNIREQIEVGDSYFTVQNLER